MKRVVVTDHTFGSTTAETAAAQATGAEFSAYQLTDEAETAAAVRGADVVLNNFAPMTRQVMNTLAPRATIIRYGVGVDNVDLDSARELGIRVCNIPDYGTDEVADHAAAMVLFLSRRIAGLDAAVRAGRWLMSDILSGLRPLSQTTVGLIGCGRIAMALARRMEAFGCTLVAYDPFVSPDATPVTLGPLEEVISSAHVLSLHVPLTPDTRHMIDAQRLAMLPDRAIVINVSRGGLIDEDALAVALGDGRVAAAGLDVFETEPLPTQSKLREAPNLFLTPHAAFFSDASVRRLQQLAADEAVRALRGEPLRCPVV